MPATVHVLAHYVAKPGKEDALKSVLVALVPPSRRELGCYQYDLLVDSADPRQFCFVERWDDDAALDQHLATNHVKNASGKSKDWSRSLPRFGATRSSETGWYRGRMPRAQFRSRHSECSMPIFSMINRMTRA